VFRPFNLFQSRAGFSSRLDGEVVREPVRLSWFQSRAGFSSRLDRG